MDRTQTGVGFYTGSMMIRLLSDCDDRVLRASQLDAVLFAMRQFERTNRAVFTKVSYRLRY